MLGTLEEKILSCYNEIGLGTCAVCTHCRIDNPALYSKAVGMWFVGKFFEEQKNRVLFIGKNARGMPAKEYKENQNSKGFLEEFRYSRENLINKSWPYWSYTKEISKRLFGDMAMEAVAFTNMVKCNGSDTIDTTTDSMKDYCIGDLAVVRHEVEIIRPTHIVLYTGTSYDSWLSPVFDKIDCFSNTSIEIGKKKMPYGEYRCKLNHERIRVLRIGHPERMQKEAFVSTVVTWINKP